ncbi:MAG: hypothetical protein V4561_03820 [Bacteroidota bacterium]
MTKYCKIVLMLLLSSKQIFAQKDGKDSVFVALRDGRVMAIHEVKKDENLYTIAQQYTVPAVVLSQNNDVSFYETLEPKRKLYIPMGTYNFLKTKPADFKSYKPLYFKSQAEESYSLLSSGLGVPEEMLLGWNNSIEISKLRNGIVAMGWILYQSPEAPQANEVGINPIGVAPTAQLAPSATVVKKDTVKGPPSELELQFNYQTSNGQFLDSLDGMVVFFKPQTTINSKLMYAFSNDIAKGRVIKVVNPSNGKFVYAKIIGSLPTTKQYLNAKIGLDGRARTELETREIKLWCSFFLKY